MLYVIIGLFALTALVGVFMFRNWLTSANTSRTVVYLHGVFAATALVLLLVHALQNGTGGLVTSLIFFVAAALGGFYMFFRDLKGKFSPIWLAAVHAMLAITGFVTLIFYVV
jgi:hypothetical protein